MKELRRALAIGAVLAAVLGAWACGHYGPPVRPEPADDLAGLPRPAPDAPDDDEADPDGP